MWHRMTILLSTVVVGFLATDALSPTTARAAINCLARPTGSSPNGSHWNYRVNRITHQRCWRLRALVLKIGNVVPAGSHEPVKSVVPETPAVVFPKTTADAQARFVDPAAAPLGGIEAASAPGRVTEKPANENLATSIFASRWIDLSEQVLATDRQPVRHSGIDQPAAAILDEVTPSSEASGRLFKANQPLDVTLVVFLVSLGGTFGLFGLLGRAFLHERSAAARPAMKPFSVAQLDDRPSPRSPSHDGQFAVEALFLLAGGSQIEPRRAGRARPKGDQRLPNPFAGLGGRLIGPPRI